MHDREELARIQRMVVRDQGWTPEQLKEIEWAFGKAQAILDVTDLLGGLPTDITKSAPVVHEVWRITRELFLVANLVRGGDCACGHTQEAHFDDADGMIVAGPCQSGRTTGVKCECCLYRPRGEIFERVRERCQKAFAVDMAERTCIALQSEQDYLRAKLIESRGGHNEPCYYCGEPCNALHGNPGLWPVALCHPDDPGVVKWHHTNCVTGKIRRAEQERDDLRTKLAAARELCDDLRGYTRDWDWKYGAQWDEEYGQAFEQPAPMGGVFDRFDDVERWLDYVARFADRGAPGCHRAGGGPLPDRSTFDGQEGFWVRVREIEAFHSGLYVWVPDEIAARDKTGRYRAGQKSPGSAG